jgi:DNA polymerase-3 subunit alpha
MSKKKASVMAEEEKYFIYGKPADDKNEEVPGCIKNGIPESVAREIFHEMVKFAEYAFNKSHAAAYAVLAYETAWLKKHYMAEFMAALMTSVSGDTKKINKYIRNCRESGIEVLPPDVNLSQKKFAVVDGAIRFGFMGVKSMNEHSVNEITEKREKLGPAADFNSFIERLDTSKVNKKIIESLIKSGAFDSMNPNRAQLLAVYEGIMDSVHYASKKNIAGQMSLFSDFGDAFDNAVGEAVVSSELPEIENFEKRIMLSMEKEILGVYVSGHPLDEYADLLKRVCSVDTEQLSMADDKSSDLYDGMKAVIGGMIQSKRVMITKNKQMMAILEIEDLYGIMEAVVFPRTYEQYSHMLQEDRIVIIQGKLQYSEDKAPSIISNRIEDIETVKARSTDDVRIAIPSGRPAEMVLAQLKEVMSRYPGDCRVIITLADGRRMKASDKVRRCEELYSDIRRVTER